MPTSLNTSSLGHVAWTILLCLVMFHAETSAELCQPCLTAQQAHSTVNSFLQKSHSGVRVARAAKARWAPRVACRKVAGLGAQAASQREVTGADQLQPRAAGKQLPSQGPKRAQRESARPCLL